MGILQSIRLQFEPVRSLVQSSIVSGYTAIGTPLLYPAHLILVQNNTDALVMFSTDGVNDHFPLPANGYIILDVTSNKSLAQGFFIMAGTTFFVKQIGTPTTGSVYVTSMYGNN